MEKTLITAENILPISSSPLADGAVFVADGIIREVGKVKILRKKYDDVETIELGSGILLPGFVNAHTHLELGWITRKIGGFNGFIGWIEQIVKAKREGVAIEEIEKSVEEGIKSLIESGVTTVGEISSYGGLDKPLLKESGLRTVLFKEVTDSTEHKVDLSNFESNGIFEERLFPHAPYSCAPRLLLKVFDSQKTYEIPGGIHLGESPDEVNFVRGEKNGFEEIIYPLIGKKSFPRPRGNSPFQYLKKVGFLGSAKLTLVHMVQVSSEEIDQIAKLDLGIALCPRSNLFLGVGAPPVGKYRKVERIGIGTDSAASNFNLDFFEEIRFFYLTFRDQLEKHPEYHTIRLATLGGAKALFLEDRTGSIEPGKEADLIFLSPENASSDPYLSIISSSKKDLKLVMVNGKVIYTKMNTEAGSQWSE